MSKVGRRRMTAVRLAYLWFMPARLAYRERIAMLERSVAGSIGTPASFRSE